jgi:hypothetical protein
MKIQQLTRKLPMDQTEVTRELRKYFQFSGN